MEERQASRQHRVILTNRGTCALNGISDILSGKIDSIQYSDVSKGKGSQGESLLGRLFK